MLALVDDMTGPALWRVLQPITALEKRGYPCGWAPKDDALIGAVAPSFDGYVLSRVVWPSLMSGVAVRWFAMLRDAGKVVVYDADDDLFSDAVVDHLLAAGLAGPQTTEQIDERRRAAIWAMRRCDGVTVTTEHLAGVVRELTDRPVIVVPNAIDVPWFRSVLRGARGRSRTTEPLVAQRRRSVSRHTRTAQVRIGWIGGQRSDDDVAETALAWSRIAASYPHARFVVGGYASPLLIGAVPSDRLSVLPWRPLERYPSLYAELDIGCAPLAATPFNASKSPIKAFEYALAGACVVASPLVYGDVIEAGTTGYLAETADEIADVLADLIERPSHRAIMAGRLARRVEREHALSANAWRWPSAWAAIAADAMRRREGVAV